MSIGQKTGVRKYRWTAKDLYRLLDKGFFRGRRVELIEGVIYEMAAQKNLHAVSIALTDTALQAAFGPGYWVRIQASLDLSPYSVPDPDLAVVLGTPRDHVASPNPSSALLVVEVSDTTLWYDRRRKGDLYARVGIADYWIVNLVHRQLEVRRNPIADSSRRLGFRYADVTVLQPGAAIAPLAVPRSSVKVADLLP